MRCKWNPVLSPTFSKYILIHPCKRFNLDSYNGHRLDPDEHFCHAKQILHIGWMRLCHVMPQKDFPLIHLEIEANVSIIFKYNIVEIWFSSSGWFKNIVEENRLCEMCHLGEVKSEFHFDDIRERLLTEIAHPEIQKYSGGQMSENWNGCLILMCLWSALTSFQKPGKEGKWGCLIISCLCFIPQYFCELFCELCIFDLCMKIC